jgi:hypothetical protein
MESMDTSYETKTEGGSKSKKKKRKKKRKATLLAKPRRIGNNNNYSKKIKITASPTRQSSNLNLTFRNTRESQDIVAKYHVFIKDIEKIKSNKNLTEQEKQKKIKKIEKTNTISLEKYQEASIFGSSTIENAGFYAGLWVKNEIQRLVFSKYDKKIVNNAKHRFYALDVGAINNQYIIKPNPLLKVTCIDLNPMGQDVIKYDFFNFFQDYAINNTINGSLSIHKGGFDAIILSLVVNFVGSPHKRGEMLFQCTHPNLIKKGWYALSVP